MGPRSWGRGDPVRHQRYATHPLRGSSSPRSGGRSDGSPGRELWKRRSTRSSTEGRARWRALWTFLRIGKRTRKAPDVAEQLRPVAFLGSKAAVSPLGANRRRWTGGRLPSALVALTAPLVTRDSKAQHARWVRLNAWNPQSLARSRSLSRLIRKRRSDSA